MIKQMSFQYKLDKDNHFKNLIKGQIKKIFIFILIFTFCYFAINMEAFLYNFPYNTPVVLITYLIYCSVIFIIMFLISIIYSIIIINLFKKNNAYKIYEYKIDKENLIEINSNFSLDLNDINKIKIKEKYIKIVSFKLKQVLTFEKENFMNVNDYNNLIKMLKKDI